MDDAQLLALLTELEVELHRPTTRGDAARLSQLLRDDFKEFGRSGSVYNKADILERLPAQATHAEVVSDRFELRRFAPDVAQLTYRAAHRRRDGALERYTWRSSLWRLSPEGWQMAFHQGTPIPDSSPA